MLLKEYEEVLKKLGAKLREIKTEMYVWNFMDLRVGLYTQMQITLVYYKNMIFRETKAKRWKY